MRCWLRRAALMAILGFDYFNVSALWFPVYCLFGAGLVVGILLRWWAQRTRVYSGALFKLCHRPRTGDLVWIAVFNECTAQIPLAQGPLLSSPTPPPPPHPPAGSRLIITSTDRRSTIIDGRDAVKFSFCLPSCSFCPDIPPPELGGIVWSDGTYSFALCLLNEPVHGEFAHRFVRACGGSSSAENSSPSTPAAAAAAGGLQAATSRTASPPPLPTSAPVLSSVNLPRGSWGTAARSSAGRSKPQPSPSPSPSPVRIPSSPDSDSDAPSPSHASHWHLPAWAQSGAVEQAARAQEVAAAARMFVPLVLRSLTTRGRAHG